MPVRIYDIAKKLGLESKTVLAKAKELGIASARVPSTALDEESAKSLEQALRGCCDIPASIPPAAVSPAQPAAGQVVGDIRATLERLRKEAGLEQPVVETLDQDAEKRAKLDLIGAFRKAFSKLDSEEKPHVLMTLAESYLEVGRFSEAARLLEIVIRNDPANALAHYLIGQAYCEEGRFQEAVENLADAQFLDPGREAYSAEINEIIQCLLTPPLAIGALLKVTAKYPENFDLKYSLGWAYWANDQLSEAAEQFRTILAANLPDDEWLADIELEFSWLLHSMGELTASVAMAEKAIPRLGSHRPRDEIEEDLAGDYLVLGRFENALKIYLRPLESAVPTVGLTGRSDASHSPRDERIYDRVAAALLRTLDAIRATRSGCQDTAELFGNHINRATLGKIYLALSRCYEETGEAEAAERARSDAMRYFCKEEE